MTEDLLSKYYDKEQLEKELERLVIATGYVILERVKRLTNETWANEDLIENMVEADRQLMQRFCDILMQKDSESSQKAAEETRRQFGN